MSATPDDTVTREAWIDAICDRFESCWRAGTPCTVMEFLSAEGFDPASATPDLLRELARVDESYRNVPRGLDLSTAERFLGDYELLELVGGNMGNVYRARQLSLPREVAVKVLILGNHPRGLFRAEVEAMARLHHPNIVRIHEVSRDSSIPYFGMEWCSRGSLAQRIPEFRIRPRRVAEVVESIARAVHFAHRRGILHRDLKPSNILFDEFDQPRVADFGLAVALGGPTDGRIAGTPAYMAPEQLTGDVTVATDVYGIGSVLYHLLTGRAPHAGNSSAELIERVREARPQAPRTVDPTIDPDLDAICMKCLSEKPSDRYASAHELADDVLNFRQGRPTTRSPGAIGRIAHAIRQARQAPQIRSLAPGLIGIGAFALVSNASVYFLLQYGAAEAFVWLELFASYVPLFAMLIRDRWLSQKTHDPARNYLWAVWAGHAVACVSSFVATRLAAGADFVRGVETGYVCCAGINVLAFIVMGCFFTGRQYLYGIAWAVAAIAMGAWLPWSPLIYAGLMAFCSVVTALQARGLSPSARIDCS